MTADLARDNWVETGRNKTQIRDASTVILTRGGSSNPRILLGKRADEAAFMPSKFVFPGGAIDSSDALPTLVGYPNLQCLNRLRARCERDIVHMLLVGGIREVWEETGLMLARPCGKTPDKWSPFNNTKYCPSAHGMQFAYRAITPPGQSRRFDARFFLVDLRQADLIGEPDDFSQASPELSDLQWISLAKASELDVPLITRFVIEFVSDVMKTGGVVKKVPFRFTQDGEHQLEML